MFKTYFVYIVTNKRNGTLYVGMTNDLSRRAIEHRLSLIPGFTAKYGLTRLVWYQEFGDVDETIRHEKRLKRWARRWKLELIEKTNPQWRDLFEEEILQVEDPSG